MGQVGIFPWSRPMPHDHSSIDQGGQVRLASFCKCDLIGNQTIPDTTLTKILWDRAIFNVGADFDVPNSRYLVPTDGWYYIFLQIALVGGGASFIKLYIYENGAGVADNRNINSGYAWLSCPFYWLVGDLIDTRIYQTEGGNKDIEADPKASWVNIYKIAEA